MKFRRRPLEDLADLVVGNPSIREWMRCEGERGAGDSISVLPHGTDQQTCVSV